MKKERIRHGAEPRRGAWGISEALFFVIGIYYPAICTPEVVRSIQVVKLETRRLKVALGITDTYERGGVAKGRRAGGKTH